MKYILVLFITILSIIVNGQVKPIEKSSAGVALSGKVDRNVCELETIPFVKYITTTDKLRQPICIINGTQFHSSILKTINPNIIEKISVVKEEFEVDDKKHYGKLLIELKDDHYPEFISLTDLKEKYLEKRNEPFVFMFDNEVVNGDYDKFIVDENYILQIVVDELDVQDQNLKIDVIRLVTRTDENIKEAKKIYIRGIEDAEY